MLPRVRITESLRSPGLNGEDLPKGAGIKFMGAFDTGSEIQVIER